MLIPIKFNNPSCHSNVDDGEEEDHHNEEKSSSIASKILGLYGKEDASKEKGANNNDRFRIHKTSAASRLTIQAYSTGSWVENIRINAGGAVELKHSNGTTHLQTTSTGAQIDTILKLYGAAGNPGKLQLQEGGALSEIRVERSTDTSSALLFGTEISGTTATRWKIDTGNCNKSHTCGRRQNNHYCRPWRWAKCDR